MSFTVVLALLVISSSEMGKTVASTNWAMARVSGLEASLGKPMPTDLEQLLDFAGIPEDVDAEQHCLAQAIYFEARGETVDGQFAVGRVVLNRVKDTRYPDTICGVVFQNQKWVDRCQFSFACDDNSDNPKEHGSWMVARRIANLVQSTWLPDDLGAATHYHADYVSPGWAGRMSKTASVGRHIFYREEPRIRN
jgi:spore germination cell wall hydrolase CwlJ-like protein